MDSAGGGTSRTGSDGFIGLLHSAVTRYLGCGLLGGFVRGALLTTWASPQIPDQKDRISHRVSAFLTGRIHEMHQFWINFVKRHF